MEEQQQYYDYQNFDVVSKIRDMEEKIRLLRDRVLLIGNNLVDERDKNFKLIQEMKSSLIKLQEENLRMKELMQRIIEQLENTSRREELLILQRQFDLFRKT